MNISKGLAPFAGTWGTRLSNVPKPCNNSLLAPSSLLFPNEITPERRREGERRVSWPHQTESSLQNQPQLSLLTLKRRTTVWLCGFLWHTGFWRGPGDTAHTVPSMCGRGSSETCPALSSGMHRLPQRLLPVFLRKTDAVKSSRVF